MILSLFYACVFALSFIIVISSLVFFHELGHYSVARFFNVAVERFSIGFGKPLTRWKAKSGTEWTINAIPLGGYVKFLGDAGAASNPDTDRLEQMKAEIEAGSASGESEVELTSCFHFKPLWQRVLIVLAGPVACHDNWDAGNTVGCFGRFTRECGATRRGYGRRSVFDTGRQRRVFIE